MSFGELSDCSYFWKPCVDRLAKILSGVREEEFYELAIPREKLSWLPKVREKGVLASLGWGLAPTASILTEPDFLAASEPVFRAGYLRDLLNPHDDFGSSLTAAMRVTRTLKDRLVVMSDVATGLKGVTHVAPGQYFSMSPDREELFLLADNLPKELDNKLENLGEVTRDWNRLDEATIIVVRTSRSLGSEEFEKASRLKLVITATHGLDHIDVSEAKRRAIIVERAPVRARAVAELTLGLILDLARGISLGDRRMREGEWAKRRLKGFEISGKKVGIISMGVVGSEIASLLRAVGMEVSFYDKYKDGGKPLDDLLKESDIVVLASPLTEETKGMIGRRELSLMKEGAYLVNVGRGELVDLEALIDSLESGKLAGAALDVFPKEPPFGEDAYDRLSHLDNVVLTPHIGGNTRESDRRIVREVLGILGKWFHD
ncbi:MAG: NAD(P)-dependent oxidoreductase [Candidatus Korarchaeota archaeon]|nr:NAD(P)-dependent oxidoreductase [Candidatus Korarchaeota archaeon]